MQCRETAGSSWVPEFDEIVFGTRGDEAFCRVPVYGTDFPAVAGEDTFFDAFVEVPYFDKIVVACTNEFGIVGRKPAY
jgi:hypothetical protein